MTSTFLHEDKKVPPDEPAERDSPACKNCGHQMWIVQVETHLSDRGTRSNRKYECSHCGAKLSVQSETDRITPIASEAVDVM
jgi:DNA-directed RNA polymerase subunit RPC12/RpoP